MLKIWAASSFLLYQNDPNPFYPATSISFDIPKRTLIKQIVYDVTGKEVSILVNEELNTGHYKVNFNRNNISNGIYFYRLITSEFTETRKMILLK